MTCPYCRRDDDLVERVGHEGFCAACGRAFRLAGRANTGGTAPALTTGEPTARPLVQAARPASVNGHLGD